MKQSIYLCQLDAVLQGEVFGDAYAMVARHSCVPEYVRQWETLHQLEVQTKECVFEAIRHNGGVPHELWANMDFGDLLNKYVTLIFFGQGFGLQTWQQGI